MDGGTIGGKAHRFTVADYYRMAEAGIFNEDSRVELIRGQIVDMSPVGAPHFGMVNRLNRLLSAMLAGRAIISVQNPLRLDDGSEPQPDVMVLRPRADDYDSAAPNAGDVLVVIEVADSSLAEDRAVKAPLYAESGITEYWIVNLVERVVEVCRQPEGGSYVDVRRVGADGVLDFGMLPGVVLTAAELFRPVGR